MHLAWLRLSCKKKKKVFKAGWCCHHHALLYSLWWLLPLHQTNILEPKSSTLLTSDSNTFFHKLVGDVKCDFAKFSWAWSFLFVRKGFHLATLSISHYIRRIWKIVTCAVQQVPARNSCSFLNFVAGLLTASFRLVFSLIWEAIQLLPMLPFYNIFSPSSLCFVKCSSS